MSASYVVFSTPHSRWIMRTPRDADGHGVGRGGPGPRSTTQIDDALRLSRSTDVWPDPTRYPKHGSHGAPARPARHHETRVSGIEIRRAHDRTPVTWPSRM